MNIVQPTIYEVRLLHLELFMQVPSMKSDATPTFNFVNCRMMKKTPLSSTWACLWMLPAQRPCLTLGPVTLLAALQVALNPAMPLKL